MPESRKMSGLGRAIGRGGRRPSLSALALPVAVLIALGNSGCGRESRPTPSATPPEAPSMELSSGTSAPEVFATLRDETLSEPERSQLLRGFDGVRVRWEGRFRSLQRVRRSPDRTLLVVVFAPTLGPEDGAPELVLASFPSSAEADLAALTPGDRIVVSGRLDTTGPRSFTLRECELGDVRNAKP